MFWEAFVSALLGLGVAYAAVTRYPRRFSSRRLALATGPAAAVLGAALAHTILGSGQALVTLGIAVGFAAAMLSLLVKHGVRERRARYYADPTRTS